MYCMLIESYEVCSFMLRGQAKLAKSILDCLIIIIIITIYSWRRW